MTCIGCQLNDSGEGCSKEYLDAGALGAAMPAMFLYGMNIMGDGLEKLPGGRLENMLEKMTSTKVKDFLIIEKSCQ